MIGAVVGVQPFGGEGLSKTGPKAGGPHYLYRFCAEQTVTVNTTAAGGNTALLAGQGVSVSPVHSIGTKFITAQRCQGAGTGRSGVTDATEGGAGRASQHG